MPMRLLARADRRGRGVFAGPFFRGAAARAIRSALAKVDLPPEPHRVTFSETTFQASMLTTI